MKEPIRTNRGSQEDPHIPPHIPWVIVNGECSLQHDRAEFNTRLKTVNMTVGHIKKLCRLNSSNGCFTSAHQFPKMHILMGSWIGI